MGQLEDMFAEKTLELIQRFVDERHGGITLRASKELGISNDTLDKWLKKKRDPGLSKIGPLIDKILWGKSKPECIGTLEVTFPSPPTSEKKSKDISDRDDRIKQLEAENAKLKDQLIAALQDANKTYKDILLGD